MGGNCYCYSNGQWTIDGSNCYGDSTGYSTNSPGFLKPVFTTGASLSAHPTVNPTVHPTADPSVSPTAQPTSGPSVSPTAHPTAQPTVDPSVSPTADPTVRPTADPTVSPTAHPTAQPTADPTVSPTAHPTVEPTADPTTKPTAHPTVNPTAHPTMNPTVNPTSNPTAHPTVSPTGSPTVNPTAQPTMEPTAYPTKNPTPHPTVSCPTTSPSTSQPTLMPTSGCSAFTTADDCYTVIQGHGKQPTKCKWNSETSTCEYARPFAPGSCNALARTDCCQFMDNSATSNNGSPCYPANAGTVLGGNFCVAYTQIQENWNDWGYKWSGCENGQPTAIWTVSSTQKYDTGSDSSRRHLSASSETCEEYAEAIKHGNAKAYGVHPQHVTATPADGCVASFGAITFDVVIRATHKTDAHNLAKISQDSIEQAVMPYLGSVHPNLLFLSMTEPTSKTVDNEYKEESEEGFVMQWEMFALGLAIAAFVLSLANFLGLDVRMFFPKQSSDADTMNKLGDTIELSIHSVGGGDITQPMK